MNMLDKVFLVVLARCRRKRNGSDLASAWYSATYKVAAYVSWPVAATTLVLVAVVYSVLRTGSPMEHKRIGQIAAVLAWLVTAFLLNRRFRKYLYDPPMLKHEESRDEKRLVFRFRAISVGLFAIVCLAGVWAHHAGFRLLQGF
jgi:hypothetical protein